MLKFDLNCRPFRAAFAVAVAAPSILLSGCDTFQQSWAGTLVSNHTVVTDLTINERFDASSAIEDALNGVDMTPVRWENPETGRWGVVVPGSALITGLSDEGAFYPTSLGLDTTMPLYKEGGVYRVNQKANVRLAPSKTAGRVDTLPVGMEVNVLGHDKQGGWYLVEREGSVLGYVYGSLIDPLDRAEPKSGDMTQAMNSGSERLNPIYCRSYTHLFDNADGPDEEWRGTACMKREVKWVAARSVAKQTTAVSSAELLPY